MRLLSKSPVFVVLIIIIGAYNPIPAYLPNQNEISCGGGTELIDGQCTKITQWNEPNIVEIVVDFVYDEIIVNEGDFVRLIFTKDSEQHYLASSFSILELNISEAFGVGETAIVDFIAYPAGSYQYESDGSCQVDIPGAGIVIVDCSIFCGETENSESGTLIIKSKNPTSSTIHTSDIGTKVCALLPDYCDGNHEH